MMCKNHQAQASEAAHLTQSSIASAKNTGNMGRESTRHCCSKHRVIAGVLEGFVHVLYW